jgi:hypothetical protein
MPGHTYPAMALLPAAVRPASIHAEPALYCLHIVVAGQSTVSLIAVT